MQCIKFLFIDTFPFNIVLPETFKFVHTVKLLFIIPFNVETVD